MVATRLMTAEDLEAMGSEAEKRYEIIDGGLRDRDRLFWILLAKAWRDWRSALVVVQPATVVRWRRQWLRR